jgi:2'-5' RNA ligase
MSEAASRESVRAFIAVELSEAAKEALAALQKELRLADPDVRWVAIGNLHVTLLFIGDLPKEDAEPTRRALETVCRERPPFALTLQGIGAFPNPRRPKTIWAGSGGDLSPIRDLAEAVGREMKALGYPPDKAFRPHITLGRKRSDSIPAALWEALRRLRDVPISESPIETVTLFQSELRPNGPVYTPLARIPLTGPAREEEGTRRT